MITSMLPRTFGGRFEFWVCLSLLQRGKEEETEAGEAGVGGWVLSRVEGWCLSEEGVRGIVARKAQEAGACRVGCSIFGVECPQSTTVTP